ncbi:uncharacterized protein LOC119769094 [Culex quinquefasciatus]|uniref:uncharacterized protein LOC119769094 n=1 Tax=Culex quinquefasciatus TaxID=7176 RepID=UPI0018E2C7B1|nr:uncharacterized protein LOC119769094 [Culex quinquefasciatus]
MTKTEEEQAAAGQVETVTVPRLNPPSMADSNIESYFMSLDFWFAASGITAQHDNRKFNIVMAQVPPNKLTELRGILEAVPEVGKYTYIKAKLIEYFADSQQRRLQRVLSDMPLGDMKPSLLFNEMKRVAGTSLSDAVLLDLWGSRLPPHAQAAVIASTGDAANKCAIADAIVDSMGLRNISAIASNSPRVAPGSTDAPAVSSIAAMQGEIAELSRKLEQVLRFRNLRGESRSRSRSRRSYGPRERDSADGPCWYHRTYGNDAERCRKPCTFGQSSSPRLQ